MYCWACAMVSDFLEAATEERLLRVESRSVRQDLWGGMLGMVKGARGWAGR